MFIHSVQQLPKKFYITMFQPEKEYRANNLYTQQIQVIVQLIFQCQYLMQKLQ
ncbi:unnamed protein product [Paramecium sonneborni]|uniref:Uncharacterized protein n=1 Tax=Paramecium sonneborni TaxID=65129 RepID=A0A8S1RM06_9CILI|nr:unnamed protein product [Paramecium sonneborni]